MHPDDLLEQLKTSAGLRKSKNLDIVHAVCREQYERGSKDFTVATIARIAHERGGPLGQSIHNKTGDDFKGLIKAWANHTGGVQRKVRKVNENPLFAVLDKIADPAVRAVMASMLAENRQLRREVNLIKANNYAVIDQRKPEPVQSSGTIQILPALTGLVNDVEKEALRHAFSDAMLRDEGWSLDDHGRVLTAKGRQVFKVGFATGFRKILDALDAPPASDARRTDADAAAVSGVLGGGSVANKDGGQKAESGQGTVE